MILLDQTEIFVLSPNIKIYYLSLNAACVYSVKVSCRFLLFQLFSAVGVLWLLFYFKPKPINTCVLYALSQWFNQGSDTLLFINYTLLFNVVRSSYGHKMPICITLPF